MRILLLMSQSSPWSLSVASSLHNAGHKIHVVAWSVEETKSYSVVPAAEAAAVLNAFASFSTVHKPSIVLLRVLRMTIAVRRLSRSISPDIVVCMYGGVFGFAAFLSGVRPYAVSAVGSDVLRRSVIGKLLNKLIFGCASIVLANGRHIAKNVLIQAPGANVTNLLIGLDTNKFRPGPESVVPRFYSHRTFDKIYNNEAIIRALSQIPESAPNFEFIFSAGGPELRDARELADKMLPEAIHHRVKFLGGGLTTEELAQQLGTSDFFVSMSFSDGTSTCLLEALSCGLFPVLSDIPANSDLFNELKLAGTLVCLHDGARLTGALLDCIQNTSEYRDQAKQNRAKIVKKCDSTVGRRILAELLSKEVLRYSRECNTRCPNRS